MAPLHPFVQEPFELVARNVPWPTDTCATLGHTASPSAREDAPFLSFSIMNTVPESLEALFESPGGLLRFPEALAQEKPQPPTTLDELIGAEAAAIRDCARFRWYRGIDAAGIVRIFRFERGGSVEQWHQLLRSQSLQSVAGPFRSPIQAHALPASELGPERLHKVRSRVDFHD